MARPKKTESKAKTDSTPLPSVDNTPGPSLFKRDENGLLKNVQYIFQKMYNALKPNGILTTYSAKGSAKRAMLSVGFEVEKIPGPPGKREMLRARKA